MNECELFNHSKQSCSCRTYLVKSFLNHVTHKRATNYERKLEYIAFEGLFICCMLMNSNKSEQRWMALVLALNIKSNFLLVNEIRMPPKDRIMI